jgi:hypothetical protein
LKWYDFVLKWYDFILKWYHFSALPRKIAMISREREKDSCCLFRVFHVKV